MSDKTSQTRQDPPPTWLSWMVRIVSLVAVLGLVAYVLAAGLGSSPPVMIDFETDAVEQRDGTWVVPVDVTNSGSFSVESLVIEMELGDETSQLTVPLLGRGATITAEFTLPDRPTLGQPTFRPVSYRIP